jgi:catechol 2,3-dioxygenase-like lactoylglutathione lyase family enzyme
MRHEAALLFTWQAKRKRVGLPPDRGRPAVSELPHRRRAIFLLRSGARVRGRFEMGKVSVRYIVADVDAAIPFYTELLGFEVDMHPAPGFAMLSKGDLRLLLNRPGAGGAGQAMPDGRMPAPGGWNRIQIEVEDLAVTVEKLKHAGCRFRNEIVTGIGGKQVLLEDPSGNPIELFEPA